MDKFLAALKTMNTQVKKDIKAGHIWRYYNDKRSEPTFPATRKAGKYYTNCFGGVAFGLKYSKVVSNDALSWYGIKGGIHFLSKAAEKAFKKFFNVVDIDGAKTVKQAIKDGTLKAGDILTYMTITHTNVYLGNGKSFDAGHAYCEGSGEGARYKKWIGDTPYQNYKIAKIVRLKDSAPSTKRKFVGMLNSDAKVYVGPGTKYDFLLEYSELKTGNLVDVCDEVVNAAGNKWYYIRIAGMLFGYVLAKRVSKA